MGECRRTLSVSIAYGKDICRCPALSENERSGKGKANVTAVKDKEIVSDQQEMLSMLKHYLKFPREWVLDSGATGYMSCIREAFEILTRLPDCKNVYMGDESEVSAYGVGTVRVNLNVVLRNVLYVPDLTVSLCFVSPL